MSSNLGGITYMSQFQKVANRNRSVTGPSHGHSQSQQHWKPTPEALAIWKKYAGEKPAGTYPPRVHPTTNLAPFTPLFASFRH